MNISFNVRIGFNTNELTLVPCITYSMFIKIWLELRSWSGSKDQLLWGNYGPPWACWGGGQSCGLPRHFFLGNPCCKRHNDNGRRPWSASTPRGFWQGPALSPWIPYRQSRWKFQEFPEKVQRTGRAPPDLEGLGSLKMGYWGSQSLGKTPVLIYLGGNQRRNLTTRLCLRLCGLCFDAVGPCSYASLTCAPQDPSLLSKSSCRLCSDIQTCSGSVSTPRGSSLDPCRYGWTHDIWHRSIWCLLDPWGRRQRGRLGSWDCQGHHPGLRDIAVR